MSRNSVVIVRGDKASVFNEGELEPSATFVVAPSISPRALADTAFKVVDLLSKTGGTHKNSAKAEPPSVAGANAASRKRRGRTPGSVSVFTREKARAAIAGAGAVDENSAIDIEAVVATLVKEIGSEMDAKAIRQRVSNLAAPSQGKAQTITGPDGVKRIWWLPEKKTATSV